MNDFELFIIAPHVEQILICSVLAYDVLAFTLTSLFSASLHCSETQWVDYCKTHCSGLSANWLLANLANKSHWQKSGAGRVESRQSVPLLLFSFWPVFPGVVVSSAVPVSPGQPCPWWPQFGPKKPSS